MILFGRRVIRSGPDDTWLDLMFESIILLMFTALGLLLLAAIVFGLVFGIIELAEVLS